jgi:hypothetical protein
MPRILRLIGMLLSVPFIHGGSAIETRSQLPKQQVWVDRISALDGTRTAERALECCGPLPAIPQPRRHPVDGQVYRPPRPLIGLPRPIAPQQLHLQMV